MPHPVARRNTQAFGAAGEKFEHRGHRHAGREAVSEQIGLSRKEAGPNLRRCKTPSRYFNSSPEIIRFTVMMYVRYPLSLRQVEDLLFERGIDICHETVRFWWNRFGPVFAAEIRKRRIYYRSYSHWR
jgi:hypothetical protein|tara:strand:+ start:121 stop:504 length:384 start_codon:yes stop_codon:yes gene_type:complete